MTSREQHLAAVRRALEDKRLADAARKEKDAALEASVHAAVEEGGLTYVELARHTGASRSSLQYWHEAHNPSRAAPSRREALQNRGQRREREDNLPGVSVAAAAQVIPGSRRDGGTHPDTLLRRVKAGQYGAPGEGRIVTYPSPFAQDGIGYRFVDPEIVAAVQARRQGAGDA
jgi:hypothetical protein